MSTETDNNIVERLRTRASAFGVPKVSSISTTGSLLFEAAEVIEKQRNLLREVLDCIDGDDYFKLTLMFPRLVDTHSPAEDDHVH